MSERTPLPPLQYQTPLCPICIDNVDTDGDAFWCPKCKGNWGSAYDAEGEANPDVEQCPAEVAPYDQDENYPTLHGQRYRCVRDVGHPQDICERHIGTRSDGGIDYSGYPHEWRDGDHLQSQPPETSVATPEGQPTS